MFGGGPTNFETRSETNSKRASDSSSPGRSPGLAPGRSPGLRSPGKKRLDDRSERLAAIGLDLHVHLAIRARFTEVHHRDRNLVVRRASHEPVARPDHQRRPDNHQRIGLVDAGHRFGHTIARHGFSEEDDVGLQDAAATGAIGRAKTLELQRVSISLELELEIGVSVRRGGDRMGSKGGVRFEKPLLKLDPRARVPTTDATNEVDSPMKIVDVAASRLLVEAIHVLRDEIAKSALLFEMRESSMSGIRSSCLDEAPPHHAARPITPPGLLAPDEGLVTHRRMTLPLTITVAIIGNPGRGAAACTRQRHEPLGARDEIGQLTEGAEVFTDTG